MKRIVASAYSALLIAFPLSSSAEAAGGIYEKNSARTVFADEIETLPAPEIEFFPTRDEEIKKASKPTLGADVQPAEEDIADSEEKAKLKIGESAKPDEEITDQQILEKFGDPNKPLPVTGVKDAPLPFQGMLMALNAGKPELAKQYARQFLHYINEVKSTTQRAQELYQEVLKEDGLVDNSGRTIYEGEQVAETEEEKFDETEARKEVRLAIGNTLPVDPFGKIDVYLFFNLEENSSLMMSEAEKLYQNIKSDSRIRFKALVMEKVEPEKLHSFLSKHRVTFPVKLGASMSERLKLSVAPTTVFMTGTSKKSVIEEGYRRFFYLDELIKLMQGKRA